MGKKWAQGCLKILIIFNICIKTIWHEITYNSWCAIKPNQTKSLVSGWQVTEETEKKWYLPDFTLATPISPTHAF